jgi:antitoxin VapB
VWPIGFPLEGGDYGGIYSEYIFCAKESDMAIAKLFQNGQSQAVRLPKAFRMPGNEVVIKKVGNAVVLLPIDHPWDTLFESLDQFSDDFMVERCQHSLQTRDDAFA